jgi:hypothetical protein
MVEHGSAKTTQVLNCPVCGNQVKRRLCEAKYRPHQTVVCCSRSCADTHKKTRYKENFFKKVAKGNDGECWIWTAGISRGYGIVSREGRSIKAHRLSYEIHHGPIPPGMLVMHSCDNPSCVNPEHLSVGTETDNVRDMINKGRNKDRRGEKHPLKKLSLKQVEEIRQLRGLMGHKLIAEKFGISKSHVSGIQRGEYWK